MEDEYILKDGTLYHAGVMSKIFGDTKHDLQNKSKSKQSGLIYNGVNILSQAETGLECFFK